MGEHHASGLWLPHQKALSINMRELLAVQLGLQAFEHLIVGMFGSAVLRQHHHSSLSSSVREGLFRPP